MDFDTNSLSPNPFHFLTSDFALKHTDILVIASCLVTIIWKELGFMDYNYASLALKVKLTPRQGKHRYICPALWP